MPPGDPDLRTPIYSDDARGSRRERIRHAPTRTSIERAVDRLRYDVGDIAYFAAKDCIQRDRPGVGLPEDFAADCHYATIDAAETAAEAAGFDIEDEDVQQEIADAVEAAETGAATADWVGFSGGGNGEECEIAAAWAEPPPRPFSIIVRRPVGHLRSRPRASRGTSTKRRGSRRRAGCSTRGSPSSSDDPDPEPEPLAGGHRRDRPRHLGREILPAVLEALRPEGGPA